LPTRKRLFSRVVSFGNLTSQFLANVLLDPLDHLVKEEQRSKGYVRFADDLRLFADSKERLHEVRREPVEPDRTAAVTVGRWPPPDRRGRFAA